MGQACQKGRSAFLAKWRPSFLWTEAHTRAAIRLEEGWNQLATEQPLFLLCASPLSKFSGEKDTRALIAISQLQTIRMCIR